MKSLFLCAMLAGIFLACGAAEGANWILLGKNDTGTAWYDRAGIDKVSEGIVRVPVKYVYSPEGANRFRDAFKGVAASEKVGYTVYDYEINCPSDSFRLLKAVTHDLKGAVIKGTELDFLKTGQAEVQHITPNSMVEKLAGISCGWAQFKR